MKSLLLPLLVALALPNAVNAEFVPSYATEAGMARAQLNLDRINKYIDRYNSSDRVKDRCKALWNIAWIANANEEPLDYLSKRTDGSWYDFAIKMREKFINENCLTETYLSEPF